MDLIDVVTAITTTQLEPGRYVWDVSSSWGQGRGALGGLAMSAVIRVLDRERLATEQSLRTLTATLCGTVASRSAELLFETLHQGSTTTALSLNQQSIASIK
ncbi:MAG: hypothetical protein AAFS10_02625 [Myxococcota bacterium]